MLFVIVAALFLSSIDEARGTYVYLPQIGRLIKTYRIEASFDEAKQQCQNDGAILASPTTNELSKGLRMLFSHTPHFIGLDARFQKTFVSLEGVRLDEMPVTNMYESLSLDRGECLSMDHLHIRVVQCSTRMPYICYKNHVDTNGVNVYVGISDGSEILGYKYYKSTGSSYKAYKQLKTWDEASAICQAENGHLIVIDNDKEAQLLKTLDIYGDTNAPHIGIKDFNYNGQWKSVTGKPLNDIYHDWEYTTPTGTGYYCGVLRNSGKIDNFNCITPREFVCEHEEY